MKTRTFLAALAAAVLLSANMASAVSIGVNFNRNTDEPFPATTTAGAVEQGNWNQTPPDNSGGVGGTVNPVIDSEGNVVTGMTVDYAANNTWAQGGPSSDGNISLLKGYLDDGGAGGTVTAKNIPYGSYDVYIYGIGDQGTGGTLADYSVSDGETTVNPTWLRAPNLSPGGSLIEGKPGQQGHYFKITGMKGPTLTITNLNNSGAGRAPLAGFQIVAIPEPSTGLLILAGMAGAIVCVRRRKAA